MPQPQKPVSSTGRTSTLVEDIMKSSAITHTKASPITELLQVQEKWSGRRHLTWPGLCQSLLAGDHPMSGRRPATIYSEPAPWASHTQGPGRGLALLPQSRVFRPACHL